MIEDAFKEWAVIVDALGEGRQSLILRKGGIQDPRGLFRPGPAEFYLLPTFEHQNTGDILPSEAGRLARSASMYASHDATELRFCARIADLHRVSDRAAVRRLAPFHIWSEDALEKRFNWGGESGLYVLVVRTSRLEHPQRIPMLPEYGGCKSWVRLQTPLAVTAASPVLTDAAFESLRADVRATLSGVAK